MNRIAGLIIIIVFFIAVTGGCSSGQSNPVMSLCELTDISLPVDTENNTNTNHNLLGVWNVTFDTQKLTATPALERTLCTHFNVTSFLPAPSIVITGYNPATEVVEVRVTITNPYQINAYDVRLIIFTDGTGNRLMNPDNWTGLYDIPSGLPVNPFKAYVIEEDYRIFEGLSEHTRDLSIHIPGGNVSVRLAIDASYPGNCEEPYEIKWSVQLDKLLDQTGSSALIKVYVHDYQYDENSVELYCPAITGEILVPFYRSPSGSSWEMELVNVTGASEGEYPGWVLAKSANSGSITLYEPVIIKVYPAGEFPYNPKVIGQYDPFYYDTWDVCVNGEYAYVTEGESEDGFIKIVNISEPANPVPMGYMFAEPGYYSLKQLGEIAVQGDYLYAPAYVSEWPFGREWQLIIIDVSNPWNPEVVGKCDIGTPYSRIVVNGDCVYIGGENGIYIIDVFVPANPQIVGEIDYMDGYDLDIQDNYLYVASYNRFYVLDITSPFYPTEVGNLYMGSWTALWISVYGDYAFLVKSMGSSFKVLNISDPENPYELTQEIITGGRGVKLVGDYAYVACADDGLKVYDISNPSDPILAGSIETTDPYDVHVEGDLVYVADQSGGLRIVDITNPEYPSQTGRLKKARPRNIDIKGDYAYSADGAFGYSIFNISNSESPRVLASYDTPDTRDITVRDNYAYIIGRRSVGDEYFKIMDLKDPFNPVEIASIGYSGFLNSLLIDGTYAYACAREGGLIIVDISVPSSPGPVYWVNIPDARNIAIEGDYAYVTSYKQGLFIVNISDPSSSQITGSVLTNNRACGIAIKTNHAYIADAGLSVVNITDPDDPKFILNLDLGSSGECVYISGNYAYLSNGGLTVIDITDPVNPELFSICDSGDYHPDIQVIDNIAYLIGSSRGLKIVELWQ